MTSRPTGAILLAWPTALTFIWTPNARPSSRRRPTAGVSLETYALQALDQALDDDWSEALAALDEHDRTGVSYAAEDAIAEFRANVEAGLAKRK
ncbi:hypothetical protein [Caulobacter sp. BE254]|uniref:hypothetical protein n=1 Tax=Caulobacter sp. BE254 TaxID=2817720 RepID=UPI002861FB33|nr:hypothetical protein [Caulobacter sp. BE254]MDR7116024.1 hypothetical protein [Caulobacter sp. BE254]